MENLSNVRLGQGALSRKGQSSIPFLTRPDSNGVDTDFRRYGNVGNQLLQRVVVRVMMYGKMMRVFLAEAR